MSPLLPKEIGKKVSSRAQELARIPWEKIQERIDPWAGLKGARGTGAILARVHGLAVLSCSVVPDDENYRGLASVNFAGCDGKTEAVARLAGSISERRYFSLLRPYTTISLPIDCGDALSATQALARVPTGRFDLREPLRATRLFMDATDEASQLVAANWSDISRLATELMRVGELSGDEIEDLLGS